MAQVHVITGVERQPRGSPDQKRHWLQRSSPGAVVSRVVRQADLCPGQTYRWWQDLAASPPGFAQVVMTAPERIPRDDEMPAIEVAFGDQARARMPAVIPPEVAAAVVKALTCGSLPHSVGVRSSPAVSLPGET